MEPFMALADLASRTYAGDLAHSARPDAPVLPSRRSRGRRGRIGRQSWRAATQSARTSVRNRLDTVRVPVPIRARIVEWRE